MTSLSVPILQRVEREITFIEDFYTNEANFLHILFTFNSLLTFISKLYFNQ